MVNFFSAVPLLPLLLLSHKRSGSDNKNSVVLADGFTLRPSFYQRSTFLLPRGGTQDNGKTALSSGPAVMEADVGPALEVISQDNWDLLSNRGKAALSRLILYDMTSGHDGQRHVYGGWPEAGVQDDEKKKLAEQVCGILLCHSSHYHV